MVDENLELELGDDSRNGVALLCVRLFSLSLFAFCGRGIFAGLPQVCPEPSHTRPNRRFCVKCGNK